ncbi:hypothetical protein BDN72DRAFT_830559 [Pluteus cervinus]|uniref:Uncharacterized protein n=1 Tax=Pluteus cervinus TaxID=181527 RepID=A0ACD3BI74_9AGAR|nr:hypothetical protein BDN72DRAFT_830559 [Pluteus cervinus]
MAHPPQLPKIDGDMEILLDIYSHPSLRVGGTEDPPNEEYGDTDRLAELGKQVLSLAVTFHYYSQTPMQSGSAIVINRDQVLSSHNIELWADMYNIKKKLRFDPREAHNIDKPEELERFWNVYTGALYIRNGMSAVQSWVSQLIDPESEPPVAEPVGQHPPPMYPTGPPGYGPPPPMHSHMPPPMGPPMHHHAVSMGPPVGWPPQHQQQPPPPPHQPPPLPPTYPAANSVSNIISVALFNQTAIQRGYAVTYPADQEGPAHQPLWTVRCCLNGQERGRGQGRNQKAAKEEAARQAWASLGWGPF